MSQTDVGKLSDRELDDRLAALGRERCRVEALLAEAAAEKQRRVGGRAAAEPDDRPPELAAIEQPYAKCLRRLGGAGVAAGEDPVGLEDRLEG